MAPEIQKLICMGWFPIHSGLKGAFHRPDKKGNRHTFVYFMCKSDDVLLLRIEMVQEVG